MKVVLDETVTSYKVKVPFKFVKPLLNEIRKNFMTENNPCENCAFHNPKMKYKCEMSNDLPVICSVKMKKIKTEKLEVKNQ